ncbi:toxin TcdB middle/N-terminal domain-containing protein, partial [Arthrospira platensis SPKY1]|nr:toxin TcdB middle/N-terminal domain-containing protein [Arthrospira platensis SPKY1]
DFNGDGVVDFVTEEDNKLVVYEAQVGKSNLLKSVSNSLGVSFTLDYERLGNKYGYYNRTVFTGEFTEEIIVDVEDCEPFNYGSTTLSDPSQVLWDMQSS